MKCRYLLAGLCAFAITGVSAVEETPDEEQPTPAVEGEGQEGAGAAASERGPDGLTEAERAFFDEFEADHSLQTQAIRADSERWYLRARALLMKAHFVEAREAIQEAIRINPEHEAAQQLRQEILAILSARGDRLQMAANWMAAIRDVAIQEQAVRMARLLAEGEQAMDAGDYREAFLNFDRVSIALRAFPYEFDWGDLPDRVERMKLEAQARARDAALARDRRLRERAEEEARIRQELEEESLRLRVDEILRRAKDQFDRGFYRRASIDAWNAWQLDRRREDARRLYQEARRRAHVQFDAHYREERKERKARINEEIHRQLIPQTELLVFPQDWFRRSLRTTDQVDEQSTGDAWRDRIANQLEQEIEFDFQGVPLPDVIAWLADNTNTNIVLAQEVFADPTIPPIVLSGRMKLGAVLEWIQTQTGLSMAIRDEAVFISTDEVQGDLEVKIYNITDLIAPIQDFEAPELAFTGGGDAGGGGGFDIFGGGGGGGLGGGDEGALTIDDIERRITEGVAPESWNQPGVEIAVRPGGQLFINQSPEIHDQIDYLLAELRNQASLEVNVQLRVLDVRRSFIEEIGIEWNDFQPVDVLRNPRSRQGYLDVNNEWGYNLNSRNVLPGNASSNQIGFGDGLRLNFLHDEGTNVLNLRQVNAVLEAVEKESDQTILNAPELTCFNGQRAYAVFMRQFAYIEDYEVAAGGNLDPEIGILNFGDIIDIQPFVSANRKYVTLEVRPSSVVLEDVFTEQITAQRIAGRGPGSNGVIFTNTFPLELPNVEVRSLRTTAMLPDKGSLMLGGYVRGLRQRTHSGIPFLSHIPFLGRLFSKNGIYDENRHIMFMVSVEIIDLQERASRQ